MELVVMSSRSLQRIVAKLPLVMTWPNRDASQIIMQGIAILTHALFKSAGISFSLISL